MSNTDFTGPLPIITPRQPQPRGSDHSVVRAQRTIIRAQRILAEYVDEGHRNAEETLSLLIDVLGEQESRGEVTMPLPRRRAFDWR
jgi:hypothetical protein